MIIIPMDELPLAVRRQLQQLKPGETASIVQDSEQVAGGHANSKRQDRAPADRIMQGPVRLARSFF